jgi:hypothetical protein
MDKKAVKNLSLVLIIFAFVLFVILGSWGGYEYVSLQQPVKGLKEKNEELKEVRADIRYKSFFNNKDIVFNLVSVSDPGKITPFILLAELAREIHYREYRTIYLQYKGKTKFILDGNDFSRVGIKMQLSSIDNVLVDFPAMVKKPNGMRVYTEPYGDSQWVLQKKAKNFKDFLSEWYLDEWIENAAKKEQKAVDKSLVQENEKDSSSIKGGDTPEIDLSEPEKKTEKSKPKDKNKTPDADSPDYFPMIEPE